MGVPVDCGTGKDYVVSNMYYVVVQPHATRAFKLKRWYAISTHVIILHCISVSHVNFCFFFVVDLGGRIIEMLAICQFIYLFILWVSMNLP
jgi:hypothetical protein